MVAAESTSQDNSSTYIKSSISNADIYLFNSEGALTRGPDLQEGHATTTHDSEGVLELAIPHSVVILWKAVKFR
eukprot:CAMPEP_0113563578 /NCGR_PEP_ID=MMETSP0015_2-20120614/21146_1 /TAXON_ID=2838 /ORGANISM="Odontella" /LENGTH=73 /DNA_ID=CAMNT_0000465573 /DNA_START=403 /DNA_END=620 /DNA_ORIENTATION=+ /assembly_acc=CAM_ASM_000160